MADPADIRSRRRAPSALGAAVTGAAAVIIGVAVGQAWLAIIGVIILLFAAAVASGQRRARQLRSAAAGETRVETVKAHQANSTISEYRDAGWEHVGSTAAKSFGSEARVTLTFRKR